MANSPAIKKKSKKKKRGSLDKKKWPKIIYAISASIFGVSVLTSVVYVIVYNHNNKEDNGNDKSVKPIIESNRIENTLSDNFDIVISNWTQLRKGTTLDYNLGGGNYVKLVEQTPLGQNGMKWTFKSLKTGDWSILVNQHDQDYSNTITIVVRALKIDSNVDNIGGYIGEEREVLIFNWNELKNPQISESNEFINISQIDTNRFLITYLKEGKTEIKISAENAITKTIQVEVLEIPKLDIITDANSFNEYVYSIKELFISNWNELENLQVYRGNENINITGGAFGTYEIEFRQVGDSEITITADNANTKIIPVEIKEKELDIETNVDKLEANYYYVGASGVIQIINRDSLDSLFVESLNTEIVQARTSIRGIDFDLLKEGETTLVLTSNNANTKRIPVKVVPKVEIELNTEKISGVVGSQFELKVLNYSDLKGTEETWTPRNSEYFDLTWKGEEGNVGNWEITLLKEGFKTLTLNYDRAVSSKSIEIEVLPKVDIDWEFNTTNPYLGKEFKAQVYNWNELNNPRLQPLSENIELVSSEEIGETTMEFVFKAVEVGSGIIGLESDNSKTLVQNIEVQPLKEIEINHDSISEYVGANITMGIINFKDLENVEVWSPDSDIVDWTNPNEEGIFDIELLKGGETEIRITADNSVEKVIPIVSRERTDIETNVDSFSDYVGTNETLEIANWESLENLKVEYNGTEGIIGISKANNGLYNVEFLKSGIAYIHISADNGATKEIQVEVLPLIKIEPTETEIRGHYGQMNLISINGEDKFKVKNFNVSIVGDKDAIALMDINPRLMTFRYQLREVGKGELHLTGDNMETFIIPFESYEWSETEIETDIELNDRNFWRIIAGEEAEFQITNFSDLNQVEVKMDTLATGEYPNLVDLGNGKYVLKTKAPQTIFELSITAQNQLKEYRIQVRCVYTFDYE